MGGMMSGSAWEPPLAEQRRDRVVLGRLPAAVVYLRSRLHCPS